MKSVPLNKFHSGYVKILREALRKHEEVIITKKSIPYFKVTPLKTEISYTPMVKENPAPRLKADRKSKGKKITVPYLTG